MMWRVLRPVPAVVSLAVWIGGLMSAQQSEAVDFRAVGTVEVKVVESGHVLQRYTNDFAVEASDLGYHIRVGGARPGAPSLTAVETLFDGTNTYVYRRYDTNYQVRTLVVKQNGRYVEQPTKKPVHSKNSANVEIVAGHFPRSKDPASMLLWIAFAAHRY